MAGEKIGEQPQNCLLEVNACRRSTADELSLFGSELAQEDKAIGEQATAIKQEDVNVAEEQKKLDHGRTMDNVQTKMNEAVNKTGLTGKPLLSYLEESVGKLFPDPEQQKIAVEKIQSIRATLDQVSAIVQGPEEKAELDNIIATSRFDFSGENNAQIFLEFSAKIESSSLLSDETKTAAFERMGLNRTIKTGLDLQRSISDNEKTKQKSTEFLAKSAKTLEELKARREEILKELESDEMRVQTAYGALTTEYGTVVQTGSAETLQEELKEINEKIEELETKIKEAQEAKESAEKPIKLREGVTVKINPEDPTQMIVSASMHKVTVKIYIPRKASGEDIGEMVNAVENPGVRPYI